MSSVTSRIRGVKQPYGGFIKPSSLHIDIFHDNFQLNEHESVAPTIVGMAVDYLSRLSIGIPTREIFSLSIEGALRSGRVKEAIGYFSEIKGTDESSVKIHVSFLPLTVGYEIQSVPCMQLHLLN